MKKQFIFLLTFFLLIQISLFAEISLPAVFGNGMVLQQQTDAAIWGKAQANKAVKIKTSWNNNTYSTKADGEGKWKVKVSTPEAGGPFSISISDGKELLLKDVLIGEVWICSGQSNMQMTMQGYRNQPVFGANEAIATSRNENIRLFTVERTKSLRPQEDFTGSWQECIPTNVANFSATAYFFGRMIHQALDVPVGLICSSWGGTRIEPWMSEEGINNFDFVDLPDKNQADDFSQQTPTVLYNAMIAPMVGYAFRGGLWYQGESNRNQPAEYEELMQGLIENWRDEWEMGDFPFYFCQIAPYNYGLDVLNSAYLRDAQRKAALNTKNAGMACLMDAGEEFNIHPGNKKAAGERLAFWALAKTYGQEGIAYSGPELKDMNVDGQMVHLSFNHANNGFTTYGKPLTSFLVAGEDKYFRKATAWITNTGITLFNERVKNPVAVRYAWEDFTVGELFNTEGLPASSFRTDDWEIK